MEINYVLVPESFDMNLSNVDVGLNEQLSHFLQIFEMLRDDEVVSYSMNIFDQMIDNGESFVDWLYRDDDMRDEKRLFQLLFHKMHEMEPLEIQKVISGLQRSEYDSQAAAIKFYNFSIPYIHDSLIVRNGQDCLTVRRFYMTFINDFTIFINECEGCFPNLFIHNRVKQTIKRFKPFRDYKDETMLHLTVLNDYGQRLFEEYQNQSENVVLEHLGIIGGIHCSIQGDPAYEKVNLCFEFPSDEGGSIKVICAPHTKLFNQYSGERIYFNWGHPNVKNGKKILIGHIGGHL